MTRYEIYTNIRDGAYTAIDGPLPARDFKADLLAAVGKVPGEPSAEAFFKFVMNEYWDEGYGLTMVAGAAFSIEDARKQRPDWSVT